MSLASLIVAGLGFGACKSTPEKNQTAPTNRSASSEQASAPAGPTSEVVKAGRAEANAGPENLLRVTDATVIVSSERDMVSDAAFLTDEDDTTAWRPNPADPKPWIEWSLPKGVHPQRLLLRFTSPLDQSVAAQLTGSGGFQRLVQLSGASVQIALGESAPATVRLTMGAPLGAGFAGLSEMVVMGTAPAAERLLAMTPWATVQTEFAPRAELWAWRKAGPYPSLEAMCAAYHRFRAALPENANESDGQPPESSRCETLEVLKPAGERPDAVEQVALGTIANGAQDSLGYSPVYPQLLFFHSSDGWMPSNLVISWDFGSYDDRASVVYVDRIESARWEQGHLLLKIFHRRSVSGGYPPEGPFEAAGTTAMVCDPKNHWSCVDSLVAYGDQAPEPWYPYIEGESPDSSKLPAHFVWERALEILPSGHLRLGPCLNKKENAEVPCLAPDYSSFCASCTTNWRVRAADAAALRRAAKVP